MATTGNGKHEPLQTGLKEEQVMENSAEGRLEATIKIKIGEIKGILGCSTGFGSKPHDIYVTVLLDHEELYRTTTIEKTINPLIGEELSFLVPRQFNRLSFYVCDGEGVSRDPRMAHVAFTRNELSVSHEFATEQWYPLYSITHDSEVQGNILISISSVEVKEESNVTPMLTVKVSEAAGLTSWSSNGHFSDTYCTVTLMDLHGALKSDVKKGIIQRKSINPIFNETYRFKLAKFEDLTDTVIRVSLWHQQLLGEDIFLGQVFLAPSSLELNRSPEAVWYSLCPRCSLEDKVGTIRLLLLYQEDYILPLSTYQPFLNLLLKSTTEPNFNDTALCILNEVCRDRASLGRSIVKLFLQLGQHHQYIIPLVLDQEPMKLQFEKLVTRLIEVEVQSTSDSNTLFRGNSVASKVIDEFMKEIGQSYLHRTLQPCIDEIFELKRSCEIDQSRLIDGENLDVNMTNLLYFVEKFMSALTSSARSCPHLMVTVFSILRRAATERFPELYEEVGYTAISGFIFLRFFAPAILNPKLFSLRPENPNPVVARSLLLISKTIQNLGNVGSRQKRCSLRKEDYMVPLLTQLMDHQHIKAVTDYLDAIATDDQLLESSFHHCKAYREGYLVKRSLARKKLTMKNFKKRYFILSSDGLSYSKARGDGVIHTIPIKEMLAVERVDETAFNMKFMLQVIQSERVLYMQAKNSVDQIEWLSVLSKVCYSNGPTVTSAHSGAYLSHTWTCCGSHLIEQPGCKSISLAIQLLAGNQEKDLERELNKLYRLLLDSQDRLLSLKEEVSRKTRSSFDGDIPPVPLPFKMSTICELIVFVKNLELSSKCKLLKRPQRMGSREAPYTCDYTEAYVVK